MSFRGVYTALVTPFRDGHVDRRAFRNLIEMQVDAGVAGIVPVGTTGESPTLTHEEHKEVIGLAVEYAGKRIQVVAGSGANSTHEAIDLTCDAESLGADGTLQVTPYYNKPSQEGLYQHFRTIAQATQLPIMLYSVPGRSVIQIEPETAARLAADCANIVSIKEAGGSVDRVSQLVQVLPEGFTILSGDDQLTLPFMSCGAVGLVSVTANIIPARMVELVEACSKGDFATALKLHNELYPLMRGLMTLDVNPVPIKCAMATCGHCSADFRLPLVGLTSQKQAALEVMLRQFGLL